MRKQLQNHFDKEYKRAVKDYKLKLWKSMHFSSEKLKGLKKDNWLYSTCAYMLELREKSRETDQNLSKEFRETLKCSTRVDEEAIRKAFEQVGKIKNPNASR